MALDLTLRKTVGPGIFSLGETRFLVIRNDLDGQRNPLPKGQYHWTVKAPPGDWSLRNGNLLRARFASRRALVDFMQALLETDPPGQEYLKPLPTPVQLSRIGSGRYLVTVMDGSQAVGILRRLIDKQGWSLRGADNQTEWVYGSLHQARQLAGRDLKANGK